MSLSLSLSWSPSRETGSLSTRRESRRGESPLLPLSRLLVLRWRGFGRDDFFMFVGGLAGAPNVPDALVLVVGSPIRSGVSGGRYMDESIVHGTKRQSRGVRRLIVVWSVGQPQPHRRVEMEQWTKLVRSRQGRIGACRARLFGVILRQASASFGSRAFKTVVVSGCQLESPGIWKAGTAPLWDPRQGRQMAVQAWGQAACVPTVTVDLPVP